MGQKVFLAIFVKRPIKPLERQIQKQRQIKGEAETPMVSYIFEKVMTKGF